MFAHNIINVNYTNSVTSPVSGLVTSVRRTNNINIIDILPNQSTDSTYSISSPIDGRIGNVSYSDKNTMNIEFRSSNNVLLCRIDIVTQSNDITEKVKLLYTVDRYFSQSQKIGNAMEDCTVKLYVFPPFTVSVSNGETVYGGSTNIGYIDPNFKYYSEYVNNKNNYLLLSPLVF